MVPGVGSEAHCGRGQQHLGRPVVGTGSGGESKVMTRWRVQRHDRLFWSKCLAILANYFATSFGPPQSQIPTLYFSILRKNSSMGSERARRVPGAGRGRRLSCVNAQKVRQRDQREQGGQQQQQQQQQQRPVVPDRRQTKAWPCGA